MTGSKVDTSLAAQPTGRAARFAQEHSTSDAEIPVLYGGWFCPFVQRAWMVMHEKKIRHHYVEINPYKKESEFLALNPRGLVPTLAVPWDRRDDEGIAGNSQGQGQGQHQHQHQQRKPLYESTVICEYLDEVYPGNETNHGSAGSSLLPMYSAYEKARCRIWIDHINSKIVPAFYRFMQHTPEKAYTLQEARDEFLGHIKTIVREAMTTSAGGRAGPWFLGDTFSMVDLMLAPWICRLFLFDVYKQGGLGVPPEGEGGADEDLWIRWRAWVDAILARDSVQDTLSDRQMYVDAYKRYAEDTTQSEVAKATRLGRNMP